MKQVTLLGSSSSLHFETCNALRAEQGIHSRNPHEESTCELPPTRIRVILHMHAVLLHIVFVKVIFFITFEAFSLHMCLWVVPILHTHK